MDRLRQKAEELLKLQNVELEDKIDDVKKLLHELHVYQIELELQNNELNDYIEKLKIAERKFFNLFNVAPIAYFLLDMKGVILDCNLKASELLLHPKDILINKPIISYIAEGKKDEFYSFIDDIITSKEKQVKEFSLFKKFNHIINVEFNSVLVKNDYILSAVIDITEKKIKDKELIEALKKAEESNKLKTFFLNTISHEIRTPLNSIVGYSQLICKQNLSAEKLNYYRNSISCGSNMLIKNIEDILLLTSLKAGEIVFCKNKFNINSILKNLVNDYSVISNEKNIKLVITDFEKNHNALLDEKILKSILKILIDNAFKFTQKGHIEVGYYTKNNNYIFYVKDSGCGISDCDLQKLFKPFIQLPNKDNFTSGLGLGLTIAKCYVELLNGDIWCESATEVGSTFYFSLPQ
ncbi:MAG: hypothetical protein A2033_12230 [Bacteroidetes bacterium GWA2_31_9]|nr:MAG: hypothetical protein A2033_12230 [Bacteroidetes bacterium GWA2_31_9]